MPFPPPGPAPSPPVAMAGMPADPKLRDAGNGHQFSEPGCRAGSSMLPSSRGCPIRSLPFPDMAHRIPVAGEEPWGNRHACEPGVPGAAAPRLLQIPGDRPAETGIDLPVPSPHGYFHRVPGVFIRYNPVQLHNRWNNVRIRRGDLPWICHHLKTCAGFSNG